MEHVLYMELWQLYFHSGNKVVTNGILFYAGLEKQQSCVKERLYIL